MRWDTGIGADSARQGRSDNMDEKNLCPECGEEMIPTQEEDDAWGGTVTILYWFCPKCGYMIRRWL